MMSKSSSSLTPLLGNTEAQYTKLESNPEQSDELKSQILENYKILLFTAASFLLFVIGEIIGALVSGSLSLLGDAGAMSVDVFTVSYLIFVFTRLSLIIISIISIFVIIMQKG